MSLANELPAESHGAAGELRRARRTGMYRAMERLLVVYVLAIVGVMVLRGNRITPDLFFVFAGIAALLMGRGVAFVRDWFPLIAIFLAWQATRGIAWQAGFPVQSDSLIAAERALHFGTVPSEVLQGLFYSGATGPHDVVLTAIYHSHFGIPLIVGFALWFGARDQFHRYMALLLLVSFAQFVTTLLMPAAPPRYAFRYGEALAVVDIARAVKDTLGWGEASWLYDNLIANPVAAFPSLHAAYPLIAWIGVRRVWPRLSWPFLGYTTVVWFTIVYLGHHYLIDAYAAAAYVAVAWWALRRWWPSTAPARPRTAPSRPRMS